MPAAPGEFLGLLRQATPESLERAALLLPVCAPTLTPRERRAARRLAGQAASLYRKALNGDEPEAGYDARGGTIAEAGAAGVRIALEA